MKHFNWAKYKSEWKLWSDAYVNAKATHAGALSNRFVEAARASPYIAGHLLLALAFICILIAGVLAR